MNPSAARPYGPKAGERLLRHRERILDEWEAQVRQAIPVLSAADQEVLRNTFPRFVDGLAQALARLDGWQRDEAASHPAGVHGRDRARHPALRISHVLLEFRLLRRVLFATLEGEAPLAPAERDCILELLDEGMARATEEFAGVHLEHEAALQEELTQSLEARDEYLSMATHELRTPIASILLGLQHLKKTIEKRGEVKAEQAELLLGPPLRQLGRLSRMVDTLLDVARVENRNLRLEYGEHDLCGIAADAVARLAEQARQAGSEITLDACAPVRGRWDRMRIEQVVTNLLTNAIKYGAGKPIGVSVAGDSKTGQATLSVVDRGIGIAQEDQQRIFERYERISADHHQQSLGLGLYIAREIVAAHDGRVRVESEPGRGAAFIVELPIRGKQGTE